MNWSTILQNAMMSLIFFLLKSNFAGKFELVIDIFYLYYRFKNQHLFRKFDFSIS